MSTTPSDALLEGVALLNPVLVPHGFSFSLGACGSSSGGAFASGSFSRDNRSLELHFRFGLGMVTYRIGEAEIDHESFLRHSGKWAQRSFPNFGSVPSESFLALAQDLSRFFSDFLSGNGEYFRSIVSARNASPNKFKGFAALSKNAG